MGSVSSRFMEAVPTDPDINTTEDDFCYYCGKVLLKIDVIKSLVHYETSGLGHVGDLFGSALWQSIPSGMP